MWRTTLGNRPSGKFQSQLFLSLLYDNCLLYLRKQGSVGRNSIKWLSPQHQRLSPFLPISRGWIQLPPFDVNFYLVPLTPAFFYGFLEFGHPSSAGHGSRTLQNVFDPWHLACWAASCYGLSGELSPPSCASVISHGSHCRLCSLNSAFQQSGIWSRVSVLLFFTFIKYSER